METDRLGDESLARTELHHSSCSDSAGKAMPQVCPSGTELSQNAISETKLLSPFDETKKPNSGQLSLLPHELPFMTSSMSGAQKLQGCCKVGQGTGSQGGLYDGERSTTPAVTWDERQEQDTEAVEDLGQQTETLQKRESPASSGSLTLIQSQVFLSSNTVDASGLLVGQLKHSQEVQFGPLIYCQRQEHGENLTDTELLVLSANEKHSDHTKKRDVISVRRETFRALPTCEEHKKYGSSEQPGSTTTGIKVNPPVSESVGELVPAVNTRTNRITLSSKRYCITAADLSKALESVETEHILQEASVLPTSPWGLPIPSRSWLMEALVKQQQEAGPVRVWVSGSPPQTNRTEQPQQNQGDRNQERELADYLSDLDPNHLPDQLIFDILKEKGYPIPGAPGWQSWLQEFQRTHHIAPLVPPQTLVPMDLPLVLVDVDDFLRKDGDLQGVEDTVMPPPIQAIENTTNNNQEPGSTADDFFSFQELLGIDLGSNNEETGLNDDDFVSYQDLFGIDSAVAQDLLMPPLLQAIDHTTNSVRESGSDDVLATLDWLPDPDTGQDPGVFDNTPRAEYTETSGNARATLQSYQAEIFTWMRNLTAMQNRPTWWDQPDHGERLVGVIQELQRESLQTFAQIDAAPGARTQPSTDHELALKQGQERPPSPEVSKDRDSMWQMVEFLHHIRREPPQFQDAQSHNQFLELVGTFYRVLIRTIEKMYGDGAKEVLIGELLQFRDLFPDQSTEPNSDTHIQQGVDTDIGNLNPAQNTPRMRQRKRNREPDLSTQRTKKAAHDRPQPEIDLLSSEMIAEKLMSSSILEWMKGLHIMRSKATRVSKAEHPLTAVLLAPQLQAFHQKVLISAEANFDASIHDVTEEKWQSTRKYYTHMITADPEVLGQISKETAEDLGHLLMNDKGKLTAWTAQYLTTATEVRKSAKNPNPVVKRERSALLRAFIHELRETALSLLDPGVAQKTIHIPESKLFVARDAAIRRHRSLPPEQRQQEAANRTQSDIGTSGGFDADGFRIPAPRPPALSPLQPPGFDADGFRIPATRPPALSPLQPPAQLLEPPESEELRISETEQRRIISDGWEGEWPFSQSLAIPVDFTPADFAHYQQYLLLTYKELKRLMLEVVIVTLGKQGFENMQPEVARDLEFFLTAYYRFAAGQVDHADPLCPRTSPPLQCCYTRKFGTVFLEPNREKRHKLILTRFIRDVYGRLIRYTNGSLSKIPDVILKQLKDWVVANGYDSTINTKMQKLSAETGLPRRQLVAWINQEKRENKLALESTRAIHSPSLGKSTLAASTDAPVDINQRTSVHGQVRHILTHWMEQHREYPYPIDSEEVELASVTNLERTVVHRFICQYRQNNRHRMNTRTVPKIHREMNKLGNGGDFGPRFELVGAPIEIPDEALQQHRPPSPIRRSGRTVGDGADKDDGEDFDLDKEIDTQLGILDAEELRNIAAQEADEDEDEDEETNFVKEIDKQLDILNVEVAEGRMTFEEAGAVAAEAREGEAAAEPDDLNRYGVAIDQDAANLLPEITDPGVRQEMRKKWMVGGGPYVSKRWRPSPEVENSPFDLMPRAKEQLKLNCLKTSEMTLDMMKAEINCLIGAHENFADGVRVHCKPNCNPAVDPYQCCFYERFGLIDQISGRQERIVASLPLFDAEIARFSFTFLNQEEKQLKKWAIPFFAAVEIEKWIIEQRKVQIKVLKPTKEQFEQWEKFLGIPERQAMAFITTYRLKCLESLKLPRADRHGIVYLRQWFEENRHDPYLDNEKAQPICQHLNLTFERVQMILSNVRKENIHRIIERYSVGKSRRCRYGPPTEEGRQRFSYKL